MAKTLKQLAEEKAKRLKQKQQRDAKKPVKVDHKKRTEELTKKARAKKTSARVGAATGDASKPSGTTIKAGKPGAVRNPPATQVQRTVAPRTSTTPATTGATRGGYVPPKVVPETPALQIGYDKPPTTAPKQITGGAAKGLTDAEIAASKAKVGPYKYIPKPKNPPKPPGSGIVSKVLGKIPGAKLAGKLATRGSAATGVLGVAATAKDVARSTITPQIEENQRAQVARESAYPSSFVDKMSDPAQQRAAAIGIDRPGMMMGGATGQTKDIQQWPNVDPTAATYPGAEGTVPVGVGGRGQIPTAMHQFGSLQNVAGEDNVRPATRLGMPDMTQDEMGGGDMATMDSPGMDFDYEFNPRTSSFDAKPYKAKPVRNVTIQDELAGASLGGLGALWAINLASKVAQGKTAANNLNETNRRKQAESEQDWNQQRLNYDKYELDREKGRMAAAIAPHEIKAQNVLNNLRAKQAEGTLSQADQKDLKLHESRMTQYNKYSAEIDTLEAEGMVDEFKIAAMREQLAGRIFGGEEVTVQQKGAPAIDTNWYGGGGAEATPNVYNRKKRAGLTPATNLLR